MRATPLVIAAALLGALACDSPTDNGPPPEVLSITVDSAGPLVRYVNVTLANKGGLHVTWTTPGRPGLELTVDSSSTQHRVFLPRLAQQRTYSVEVRAVNRLGDKGTTKSATLTTGALPAGLAALKLTAQGTPTLPLTMFELMITTTGWNGAFIADADGEIVWYWQTKGWINGISRRENGNFVMLDADSGLVELSPDAQVVHRLRNGTQQPYGLIHHDLTVTPTNTVYFFARDTKVIRDTSVVGEAIWEWRPEIGQVTKKWSSFDAFDWARDRGPQTAANNWMHANSIMIGPRGNIVVSARNLDEVFSISPNFQAIEWRLGGPSPTIQLPEADRFYSQHSAVEVSPNRILLLDNGLGRPNNELWSRAIELQINPTAHGASAVWSYRPQPDINALRVGSVVRLSNGNTVAGFGWGQGFPITAREITPNGQVVWSLTGKQPEFDRVYRMKPMSDIAGERTIQ
jgi:Arylsulfotransferase (ASST)